MACVWMIKCCDWDLTGDCFSSISQTNWFCTSHKSTDVQHHRGRPQRRDGSFCCFTQSHRGGCCGCLHHPLREVCASSSPSQAEAAPCAQLGEGEGTSPWQQRSTIKRHEAPGGRLASKPVMSTSAQRKCLLLCNR